MRFTLTEADIDAVHRVKHCAERRDYQRSKLEGVVLGPDKIAATDSYRMAFYPLEADIPEAVLLPNAVINDLPVAGDCRMLFKAIDDEHGTLSFTVGGERITWPSPVMKKEGWSRPRGLWPHHVTFGRKNLLDALKLVAPRSKFRFVALHSEEMPGRFFGGFGAGVLGDHPETGEPFWVCAQPELVTSSVDAAGAWIPGWMPTVIVAQRFLVEMVRAVHADVLTVASYEPYSPLWLRSEDDLLEQMLMPVRSWPKPPPPPPEQ